MKLIFTLLLFFMSMDLSCAAEKSIMTFPTGHTMQQDQSLGRKLVDYQNTLRSKLTAVTRQLKENPVSSTATILLISFIYGVVHSIGPGHNKGTLTAYMLSRRSSKKKAALIGAFMGALHGLSTIILVLLIYFFTDKRLSRTFDAVSTKMMLFSATVIIVTGCVLLLYSFKHFDRDQRKDKSFVAILASGLVPCPATFILMAFFLSLGLLPLAIASAVALTLGMSVTLLIVSLTASRGGVFLSGKKIPYQLIKRAGAGLLIFLGIILFFTLVS